MIAVIAPMVLLGLLLGVTVIERHAKKVEGRHATRRYIEDYRRLQENAPRWPTMTEEERRILTKNAVLLSIRSRDENLDASEIDAAEAEFKKVSPG